MKEKTIILQKLFMITRHQHKVIRLQTWEHKENVNSLMFILSMCHFLLQKSGRQHVFWFSFHIFFNVLSTTSIKRSESNWKHLKKIIKKYWKPINKEKKIYKRSKFIDVNVNRITKPSLEQKLTGYLFDSCHCHYHSRYDIDSTQMCLSNHWHMKKKWKIDSNN
jgi:hypothetical protein